MENELTEVGRDRRARRAVFLTGASSGIGLEIAQLLVGTECEVWGTSRDPARLPKLPRFHPVAMDLLQPDSIRSAFPRDVPFDVLINNAGAGLFGALESLPGDAVAAQFQLLLHAPLELIQLVLPSMRARGRGMIVNITSLAAQLPIPFMAPYNAAKAALSAATRALRLEMAGTPVRVVEIQPGDIHTPFHEMTTRFENAADRKRLETVWETISRNMAVAPPPDRVARAVLRAINDPHPPPVLVVGGFFQARIAPLGVRLLPPRLWEWGLRRYYGI